MHGGSSSFTYDNVFPNSLEPAHVSTFSSPPSSSSSELAFDVPNDVSEITDSNVDLGHESHMLNLLGGNNENFESLGYFRGYDAALDPYCIDLVDLPRKIMWHTFFNFSFDFSMAFTVRGLILFFVLICRFSHSLAGEPHAVAFDKLLRALTMSSLSSQIAKARWSG